MCFREVSKVFQGRFKGVPRKFCFSRSFNGVLSGFQACLKKLKGCLREVFKVFQGCFQDILRVFQGRLWGKTFKGVSRYLKEVQRVFQGGFRDVLRKFQGCLKKVSSVFQENFIKKF